MDRWTQLHKARRRGGRRKERRRRAACGADFGSCERASRPCSLSRGNFRGNFLQVSEDGFVTRPSYMDTHLSHGLRCAIGQIRTSSHQLEIEFGRFQGIPPEDRLCKLCGTEPETELYYVCHCTVYYEIRGRFHCLFKEGFGPLDRVMKYEDQRLDVEADFNHPKADESKPNYKPGTGEFLRQLEINRAIKVQFHFFTSAVEADFNHPKADESKPNYKPGTGEFLRQLEINRAIKVQFHFFTSAVGF
ncbi:hypothetical protein L7F22_046915 [Adiantum nelumboides]|nr:hypothetical protein [Adiantum nelumboides]